MSRLRYTAAAQQNLQGIATYIAAQTGERATGSRFVERIRARCRRLAALPGILGTARPDIGFDLRSTPCSGYVIFFRYRPGTLEIVDVLHGRRDVLAYFEESGDDDSPD